MLQHTCGPAMFTSARTQVPSHHSRCCALLISSSARVSFRRRRWAISASQLSSRSKHATATPHAGYHNDGSGRRFFEGWYFKVTIPELQQSFALIYSIEDPVGNSRLSGIGAQVMGLDDGYILQYDRDVRKFWATRNELELGATFKQTGRSRGMPRGMLAEAPFNSSVEEGFQASYTWHQGNLLAREDGAAGSALSTVPSCSWAFQTKPVYGWGDAISTQKPTAGWLSLLAIFEPHWQVLMSHGLSSGWFQWGERRIEFQDAPSYFEKNWGGGFPSKWHWIQCNTFDGQPNLSLTAVGARRGLLGVPGLEEDVGMIGIHFNGTFIELVPWNGQVEWDVDPWGRWVLSGHNDKYEAIIEATCTQTAGQILRAPTANMGLAPLCKDTFFGRCRAQVWEKGPGQRKQIIDAVSSLAALEVGGGPWWSSWAARADMKEPFRSLVKLPLDVGLVAQVVPQPLQPPGL